METNKKELAKAKKVIGLLKRFAPRKCTMPILGYIKVTSATFEATDLDSQVIVYRDRGVGTKIVGSGCFRLTEAETLWTQGGIIEKGTATLSTGKLIGVDSEEYPNVRLGRACLQNLSSYSPSTCEFWDDLQTITQSASKDETRYNLLGVLFSGGRIVATDGHRLAMTETRYNFPGSSLVPAKFLQKFAGCGINGLSFYLTAQHESFNQGFCEVTGKIAGFDFRATVRLIDMEFPDYGQVLKNCSKDRVGTVASANLLPHLEKCADLIPDKEKGIAVTMNGDLRVTAKSPQFGDYSVSVPYNSNCHNPITVGFNAEYLSAALSAESCDIYGKDNLGPWLFRSGNVDHVVMPMRLE